MSIVLSRFVDCRNIIIAVKKIREVETVRHRKRRIQRRYSTRFKIGTVMFALVITVLVIAAVKADRSLRPVASVQAEHCAILMTNETIESSVSEYLSENNWSYSDFVTAVYDGNGETVALETNSYNINKVQSELTLQINHRLEAAGKEYHKIPIGSLTDSYMLAGRGPNLRIRVCPLGSAQVELESGFDSAGINQTRHTITAAITVNISSSLPLYEFETQVNFDFLIAENVIIGTVPSVGMYGFRD